MATLNEFKITKQHCKKMFTYIPNIIDNNLSDIQKERLGFYHLVLEQITGLPDASDIQVLIQDTEYLKHIGGIAENDLGVDAVYINKDAEEIEISIFSFKYREKFNPDKTASENDISISMKFFQYLNNNSILPSDIDRESNLFNNIKTITESLSGDKICNTKLYYVTNEPYGFSNQSEELINTYADNYGIEIKSISLDDIISFMYSKDDNIKSRIMMNYDDFISYNDDSKSTGVSYICKISLLELIRITCSNHELRKNYNIENDELLKSCNVNYMLLYENVRGYLGETTYNKNIYKTIETNCKNFFLFNNGITITCNNIISEQKNSKTKYLLSLEGLQIVNGGQTLRTIYSYLSNNKNDEKLANLEMLVY